MTEDRDIEKLLNGLPKEPPYKVPGDYFSTFAGKLKERLPAGKDQPVMPIVSGAKNRVVSRYAIAAAVAAFIILGYIGFLTLNITEPQTVSNEAISEYIDLYHYQFTEEQLVGLIFENGDYTENEFYFDSPELYIDYLYNTDIDIDLLLMEF